MTAHFLRYLTIEEAAERLGVSVARISMWIGECKLPVAARSEYAGYLLHTQTVETVGHDLASALPPEARFEPPDEAPCRTGRTRGRSAGAAFAATA
jgi:excisionase family DNA binding protein